MSGLMLQLKQYRLTTAEILYHMPDHPSLLQSYLWQEYDLAPGVVCPNGTLEAIARLDPTTTAALGEVTELRRWQLREFGEELLKALRGPPAQDGGG